MVKELRNKKEILSLLADHKKELLNYGVLEIGLFGSYVRDEATKESDIDLLVDISKDLSLIHI